MPRRDTPPDYVHQDRWVISYADFITLLFAFFVVMYSLSSVNEEKYKNLSEALSGAFDSVGGRLLPGTGETSQTTLDIRPGEGNDPVSGANLAAPDVEESAQLKRIETLLNERILPGVEAGLLSISSNELWLAIELSSNMLFAPGQATPTAAADELLERLAILLRPFENPIHVEGFTDNQAIDTAQFPSNWELSAARAAAVVRVMAHYGVPPERMAAVGYGEYQPAYSNRTEQGRELNRRVVIVISRDERVRRSLSAVGAEQVSGDVVSTMISTGAQPDDATVVEQVETATGGKLFRQVTPQETTQE